MAQTATLHIKIEPSVARSLKKVAGRRRVTVGELVRQAVQTCYQSGTIAAALHRRGVAVTDDMAARRTCAELGVPVTGTIGILVAAVRDKQLVKADAEVLLLKMIAAGFHSPVKKEFQ